MDLYDRHIEIQDGTILFNMSFSTYSGTMELCSHKQSIFYHSTWVERFKNRCEKMVAILKIQDGVMSSFHYMHLATYRK